MNFFLCFFTAEAHSEVLAGTLILFMIAGHYQAFVRNVETGNWTCCNDASVTLISEADLAKGFGGVKFSFFCVSEQVGTSPPQEGSKQDTSTLESSKTQ